MATRISGAGSSGNNDERTAERLGRSGRVIQPLGNFGANAAIRTATDDRRLQVWARSSGAGCHAGEHGGHASDRGDSVREARGVIVESEGLM